MLERLGLKSGQMRQRDLVHNGGWYDKTGQKIGWGDLEPADMRHIKDTLKADEIFYILPESDSFWNFVTSVGPIGSMCETEQTVDNPGIDYVLSRAHFVIKPGVIYFVSDYGKPGSIDFIRGLEVRRVRDSRDIK